MIRMTMDVKSARDYETFLAVRKLPSYGVRGRDVEFPEEYAAEITGNSVARKTTDFVPSEFLFDYQRDIAAMAVRKEKFCVFADCGLGKTLILLEYAKHCASILPKGQCVLIISPLMVVSQTVAEASRWYGDDLPIEVVPSSGLAGFLSSGGRVGITNYEALKEDIPQGRLGALIVDESSMLKSAYGHYGTEIVRLGKGLRWKLALTGTPAPNDRIEYGNHAVLMDAFKTNNEFLARYFVNRGETQNRWEILPHAVKRFYRDLLHWCIFLTNPSVYGWQDNCETIPPINVHIEHVEMTDDQNRAVRDMTGSLFVGKMGGITTRQKLSRIAKGKGCESLKPEYIRRLVESWKHDRQTIVWCLYNDEQDGLAAMMPDAGSIDGTTPIAERQRIIDDYKRGAIRTLISKPKIMGFGLNLQCCTKMVFSGLQDSYESYYQAVKRANRYGATHPLDVHIPVTEVEVPMIETVLAKAKRVAEDTAEQERLFKEMRRAVG
jgi:superfamily II DNA or RNA helicase